MLRQFQNKQLKTNKTSYKPHPKKKEKTKEEEEQQNNNENQYCEKYITTNYEMSSRNDIQKYYKNINNYFKIASKWTPK